MRYLTPVLFAATASILSSAPTYADLGDQLAKLLANDGAANDRFGYSIAIDNGIVAVGAYHDDGNSGSAYLFNASTGAQIAKLLPSDGAGSDFFGVSIAIDNSVVAVGAFGHDDNGDNSGSAYLFDISDPKTPVQIAKLLPNDAAAGDWFGFSIALDNGTVAVGAPYNDDNGSNSGSAYLFNAATGAPIVKYLPSDGAAYDAFGRSIAIDNNIVAVGAANDDDNGSLSGSAYLFHASSGAQIAKILPIDGVAGDLFGHSIAIDNGVVAVGARRDDDNGTWSGSAYLFNASTGAQIAKLLPIDGVAYDRFGVSVAISGATAIIGAVLDDDNGSTYLFDTTTGRQIAKLLAKDGAADDLFGHSVGISGATAIVGAHYDDDNGINSGSAYLFDAVGTPACPWDLDGNAVVGVSDLLSLLASWGPCPPKADCPADFDGNGSVGASDLLALLANWGPCP